MNLGILLGFLAACGWGSAVVFAKIGLRSVPTGAGTLVSLWAGFVFLLVTIVCLNQLQDLMFVNFRSLCLMALLGIITYPIGRFCNYMGITYIGVSRATPIVATNPLIATIWAITLGGEQIHLLTGIGTLAIISGISLILSESLNEKG